MNRRRHVRAIVLALLLAAPAAATLGLAAPWQPDDGDWATLKGDATHDGATGGKAAFDLLAAGFRLKWQRTDDPGYWVPPVAADLDGDGIAEVVATVGNVSADPTNLANPVDISGGVNVVDGKTGALRWRVGPTTGNLPFFSPTLADVNGDGKGDIVFLDGAPLTGSATTNKVFAYSAAGQLLWSWSDSTGWGTKVPLPVTQVAFGNVDGESTHREVVALVLLANMVTSIQGGKVLVAASNPEYRLVALNGEGASASAAWQLSFGNASASSPALGDLDGDGILDVVFGSGIKPGTWVETDSAKVTFTADFADDRLMAYKGASSPTQLWAKRTTGQFGGDTGSTPALADLDGDGRLDVVETLWSRVQSPTAADTGVVQAWSAAGALRWSRTINASIIVEAAIAPPTIGDLDGDGRPEVLVQTGNGGSDAYRTIALRGTDGSVLWRASMGRVQSGNAAIGDLDGDGDAEVVGILRPGTAPELYVLDGATGALRMKLALPSSPSNGGPVLVDLDGDDDGRLEILVNTGAWGQPGQLLAYEAELPDLRVASLGFNVSRHEAGVAETARATVTNAGNRTATDLAVDFLDGTTLVHTAVVTLAPGASALVEAPWTPATPGNRTFRVVADRAKAIPEGVETDNQVSSSIHIGARPVCALGVTPVAPDEGQPVTFRDLSTDADNNIFTRAWTFGDGGSANGATVSRTYADGGLYQVALVVTDGDGFQCSAGQGLAVGHLAPAAAFDVSTAAPTELEPVVFADRSTHPNAADAPPAGWAWAWAFGEGATSATRSPIHHFPDGGAYAVSLQVTDDDAQGSIAARTVQVAHVAPTANFSMSDAYPDLGEQLTFTDLSHHPAPWDRVAAWSWEFGDGAVSSAANPVHAYAARGVYTVRLTVTDDDGLTSGATRSVNAGNLPPEASFTFSPGQPRGGEPVRFTDASTDDGSIVAWAWSFGDGATSSQRHPSHRFALSGTYEVRLTVTDDAGQAATATASITATNDAPAAAFTFSPEEPAGGALIQFTDTSADDGAIVAWAWTFGDGATSSLRHPSHRFTLSGTYEVTLTVTDDFGQTGAASATIVATNSAPVADFAVNPERPNMYGNVQFTDRSTDPEGPIAAWAWDFGDGATSALQNPAHRYSTGGTHRVTLTVTDGAGATGTASRDIEVCATSLVRDGFWPDIRLCGLFEA